MRRHARFAVSLGLLALVAGCGQSGSSPQVYPSTFVEGDVTLDGKPIENGSVQFVPQDGGKTPITQAIIVKGRYVASKVPQGKVVAMVHVDPPTPPGSVGSDYVPPATITIPDRYKDGIPIDVTGEKMTQDFPMSSKKK